MEHKEQVNAESQAVEHGAEQARACALKTSIGGQALMEGIMMRGPKKTAIAVRNTKGEIVVEESENKALKRPKICKWPIIRGVFGYIDSMVIGYKALMRSAELSGLEDIVEESPRKKKKREAAEELPKEQTSVETIEPAVKAQTEQTEEKKEQTEQKEEKNEKDEEKIPAWVMTVTMIFTVIFGFALALALFAWLPTQIFVWLSDAFPGMQPGGAAVNSLIKSGFEGVLRIAILVGYMAVISLMKDIRRTFMYHGAEHKSIFCYEAGLELTVENIRRQRRFHPRCGTSFLILMLLVSVFISFFIDPIAVAITGDVLPTLLRVGVKLLLLPLIVGMGYELIKFAGRHDNWFTRLISLPGVWLQHITVFEPTDDMIECAIAALTPVIPKDGSDEW